MKFTVKREKLQKALQKVSSIIGSRSMLPLLGNVLIEAEENMLKLCTTDLELRLSTELEAEVTEAGITTLPARKLAQLTASFTAEDMEFTIDDKDHAKVVCGTAKFTILGLPAADFPEANTFQTLREVRVEQNKFKRMINSIIYAVSADDSRKVLTGVLFNIGDARDAAPAENADQDTMNASQKLMTLVATDGKRMALNESIPASITGDDGKAIIPLKAMSELRRLLDAENEVIITFGEKQCAFVADNFTLQTKLIDGDYPKYTQVIPKSFNYSLELPVQLLLAKIETVALMLTVANSFVILRFTEGQLEIKASSSEVGEGCDMIEAAYSGEDVEVSFNPTFLADPLRNTDADMVRFKFNDRFSPIALEAGEGFVCIIMPMRTNNK